MRVYLLRIRGKRRPRFYSEDFDANSDKDKEASSATTARGARGRLERWSRSLKAAVAKAARAVGPRFQRMMAWLSRRPAPDEPLLRALRSAPAVELIHPENETSAAARRHWRSYLAGRERQSALAGVVDLGLGALSLPLMLLPGPNVVGLWFLYRAVGRFLAVSGTRRARREDRLPTTFRASGLLDAPLDRQDADRVAVISAECGLKDLGSYLRRLERRGDIEEAAQLAD